MPPMQTPPSGAGLSTPPSGGLPSALLAPTTQPGVPVSTPLAAPPVNPIASAATDRQRNLIYLDALATNPNNSAETRQWATEVRNRLISMSTGR